MASHLCWHDNNLLCFSSSSSFNLPQKCRGTYGIVNCLYCACAHMLWTHTHIPAGTYYFYTLHVDRWLQVSERVCYIRVELFILQPYLSPHLLIFSGSDNRHSHKSTATVAAIVLFLLNHSSSTKSLYIRELVENFDTWSYTENADIFLRKSVSIFTVSDLAVCFRLAKEDKPEVHKNPFKSMWTKWNWTNSQPIRVKSRKYQIASTYWFPCRHRGFSSR